MISVILTVLKALGIILLVILGILLLAIGLLLFVPVRYRADGAYQDKKVNLSGHFTWLLHAVSAKIFFEPGQPFHIHVRLFGIPVFDNLKKARKSSQKEEKAAGKKKKNKKAGKKKNKNDGEYTDTEIQAAAIEDTEQMFESEKNTSASDDRHQVLPLAEASQTPKMSIIQKIKNFFGKLIQFFKNMMYTFHRICDTITKVQNNIRYYWDILQQESTKSAICKCKTQLWRIVKSLLPRKYQVHLHLGFEDPAVMGEVMAVWGALYPFHEGRIDLVPEFGQTVAEADFTLKGRMVLWVYLRIAASIYFDKNIKQIIKQFRAA